MNINCYQCKHRGSIPGDAHSRCMHSKIFQEAEADILSMLLDPVKTKAGVELDIQANPHGVKSGWFNWPWNFDPVWLENCNGFEES